MQPRQNRKATRRLGLALTAVIALAGSASAEEAMKVRPGFGYTIDFMTGTAAEALLPARKQEAVITRPGFGYTIDFMTGAAAEALLPVPEQEVATARPALVTP
jgi:hypothetical protein